MVAKRGQDSSLVHSIRLELANLSGDAFTVVLEPWGQHADVAAEDVVVAEVSGPGSGTLQMGYKKEKLLISVWDGATARLVDRAGRPVEVRY